MNSHCTAAEKMLRQNTAAFVFVIDHECYKLLSFLPQFSLEIFIHTAFSLPVSVSDHLSSFFSFFFSFDSL